MKNALVPLFVFLALIQTSVHAGECISAAQAATKFVDFFAARKSITLPLHNSYMDEFAARNPVFANLFHQGKNADPYDSNLYSYKILGAEAAQVRGPLVQEIQQSMAFRAFNGVGPSYVVDIPEYFLMIDCSGKMRAFTAWATSDGGGDEVRFPQP